MDWLFNPLSLNKIAFSVPPSPISIPSQLPTIEKSKQEQSQIAVQKQEVEELLKPFQGVEVPKLARTRPDVLQKKVEDLNLLNAWRYLPFLASQGTALTKAFVNHHLYGPPKPSWGIELTLFTAFLREAAAYSHLSTIARLRAVLDLGSLLPPPKDGIVTPVSFKVKKRGLRGFLAEADAGEDGARQISGEWVINKKLWKKMQTEFATNKIVRRDRVILYLHGGAYYVLSAKTHRFLTISVSRYTESRVFAVNYRLAPETRFPGQLHDAVSSYLRLIEDLKIPPENIVFEGDSAGAGLCLATLMYLRDEGYPLPSGAILQSPWVDLTMSCSSWTTNAEFDYLPQPAPDDHLNPIHCLLGEEKMKYLTHPYVSPLFGTFEGLPPLLIQAGEAEVLRDEITLLAHKASQAGVIVEHEIFEDCVHVFTAFLFLEASRKAFQSQRHFVKVTIPQNLMKSSSMADVDLEIATDAHEVDEQGYEVSDPLPATPIGGPRELQEESDENDGFSSDDSPSSRNFSLEEEGSKSAFAHLSKISSAPKARPTLRSYVSTDLMMTPSSPLSPGSPSKKMESRQLPQVGLHARSNSHPDLTGLFSALNTGPVHLAKVYSMKELKEELKE